MGNKFRALTPKEMEVEMKSLRFLFREMYLKLLLFFLRRFKEVTTEDEKEEIKGYIGEIGSAYVSTKNHV